MLTHVIMHHRWRFQKHYLNLWNCQQFLVSSVGLSSLLYDTPVPLDFMLYVFIAAAADLEAVLLESNYCFGLVSLTILLILLPLKSLLLCVIIDAAAAVLGPLLLESNYCCHRWVKPPRRSFRVCWIFSSETQDTCIRLFFTLLLITVFLFSPVFKNTAPALTLSVARRSVNSCVRALKSATWTLAPHVWPSAGQRLEIANCMNCTNTNNRDKYKYKYETNTTTFDKYMKQIQSYRRPTNMIEACYLLEQSSGMFY